MKCCAVIVTYNPDHNLERNLLALLAQFEEIIIVDNGSGTNSRELIYSFNKYDKVYIILNSENLGIASALNQGVKYALEKNYEWVGTFDQDSLAPENFVVQMLATYNSIALNENIAILAPIYYNDKAKKYLSHNNNSDSTSFSEVTTVITSGNLVKVKTFQSVGFFNEGFFIDYVDNEFCLRCRQANLKIIEINKVILNHNLGNPTIHKFFGFTLSTSNHSPLRRYYKYRNRVRVYMQYYNIDIKWTLRDLVYFFGEPIKILLLENNKLLQLSSILKGTFHGLYNVEGKYEG